MRTVGTTSALLLVAIVTLAGFSHRSASADSFFPPVVASINVTNAQVIPEAPSLVRAFIPTGSNSVKCVATMNETTFVDFGTQLFCGQRTSPTYGHGILITLNYFSNPVPPDYGTSLTIWQAGAKYYGAPIMCETAGAC